MTTPETPMGEEKLLKTPCCGYQWDSLGDDRKGPIFWNPFNGAVQCHNCGAAFDLPSPPLEVVQEALREARELIGEAWVAMSGTDWPVRDRLEAWKEKHDGGPVAQPPRDELRKTLIEINAQMDAYWNGDRSEAQVKRIEAAQQQCKRALSGSPSSEDVPSAQCAACGEAYGSPRFPDLVLPHDVWQKISPSGDENGLLCPNCICAALTAAGIETRGEFRSGPLAVFNAADPSAPAPLASAVAAEEFAKIADSFADAHERLEVAARLNGLPLAERADCEKKLLAREIGSAIRARLPSDTLKRQEAERAVLRQAQKIGSFVTGSPAWAEAIENLENRVIALNRLTPPAGGTPEDSNG